MVLNHSSYDYFFKPRIDNFNQHESQLANSNVPQ